MVTVREGRPEDAEGINWVHQTAWKHAYAGLMPQGYLDALDPADPERIAKRRTHLEAADPTACTLVAVDGETIVGFTNAGPYRDKAELTETLGGGEVYAIYADPTRLRTGVGYALMNAAVRWLAARDLAPVRLWMLTGNARALAFYERYGFRLDGGRAQIAVEKPGELPVELPEVRLTLLGLPVDLGGPVDLGIPVG